MFLSLLSTKSVGVIILVDKVVAWSDYDFEDIVHGLNRRFGDYIFVFDIGFSKI